jgi:hypothetical protein
MYKRAKSVVAKYILACIALFTMALVFPPQESKNKSKINHTTYIIIFFHIPHLSEREQRANATQIRMLQIC